MEGNNVRSLGASGGVKGSRDLFQGDPSSHKISCFSGATGERCQMSGLAVGNRQYASQRSGGGTSGGRSVSGILFPPLFGSQKVGQVETYHRPERSESLGHKSAFQNDNAQNGHFDRSARPLGFFNRFEGCLLSRTSGQEVSQVPQIHLSGQGVPVPGAAFWPHHSAAGFHQAFALGGCVSASEGDRNSYLFRRFPRPEFFPGPVPATHQTVPRHFLSSGFHSFGGEVGNQSFSGFCFPRLPISDGSRNYPSSGGQVSYCSVYGAPVRSGSSHFSPSVSQNLRISELHSGCSSAGPTSLPYVTGASPQFVDASVPQLGVSGPPQPASEAVYSVVEHSGQRPGRSSFGQTFTGPNPLHGCFTDGLGRFSERSHGKRLLESQRGSAAHKSLRDEGGFALPQRTSAVDQEHSHLSGNRQFHSGCLFEQPRGHQVSGLVLPLSGSPPFLQGAPCAAPGEAHSRQVKHTGGHPVQVQKTCYNRVDSINVGVQTHLPSMGSSTCRSVRHGSESPTSDVCLSSSGRRGPGHRRLFGQLERDERLCVPSLQSSRSGGSEGQGTLLCSYSDSPSLVGANVVPGPSRSSGRLSAGDSPAGRSPVSAGIADTARQTGHAPPSRLEAIQGGCVAGGFSQQVADRIPRSVRSSSSAIYASRWKIYCDWCVDRQIDPVTAPVTKIADFLLFLFKDKGFSPSTISGYKSAIANVFVSYSRGDISTDRTLSALIRSFHVEKPKSRSLFPQWNLALVLESLLGEPYEPLQEADIKFLTYKCVFLLTLATGRRRGDVHALSMSPSCLRWAKDYSWVTIATDPVFVAKNQLANFSPEPVKIPSLANIVGRADRDRLLCPVRSLRFYLAKTKGGRGMRHRLFLPIKAGKEDISAESISRWIVQVIKRAYTDTPDQHLRLHQVRAHEVRALASSWALANGVALDNLMSASFWRGHSTFTNFYLRSLANHSDSLYSLGPIVAAQSVIEPPQ